MNGTTAVDAVDLNKNLTINVRLKRYAQWRARWWIAMQLLRKCRQLQCRFRG